MFDRHCIVPALCPGAVPVSLLQLSSCNAYVEDKTLSCLQFRNKAREKQRQLTIKQRGDTSVSKVRRGQAAPASCPQQLMQKKLPAAKRRRIETQEDDAALVEDYRHLKKLKNGQITQVKCAH